MILLMFSSKFGACNYGFIEFGPHTDQISWSGTVFIDQISWSGTVFRDRSPDHLPKSDVRPFLRSFPINVTVKSCVLIHWSRICKPLANCFCHSKVIPWNVWKFFVSVIIKNPKVDFFVIARTPFVSISSEIYASFILPYRISKLYDQYSKSKSTKRSIFRFDISILHL